MISTRRLGLAGALAALPALLIGAVAFACTTYQGTFTVCGNDSTSCVTATGSGSGMNNTVSGSTSVTSQNGSVTVAATGLTPSDTYNVRFAQPVLADLDCMTTGTAIGSGSLTTDSSGNIATTAPMALPTSLPGVGAVCIADGRSPSTGNEAPVTIVQ